MSDQTTQDVARLRALADSIMKSLSIDASLASMLSRAADAMERLASVQTELRRDQGIRHGFDMEGPDIGVDGDKVRGMACRCHWYSESHGDKCPEHGKKGTPIKTERDRLLESVKILCDGMEEIKAAQLITSFGGHGGETYYAMNERIKGIACGTVTLADAILAGKEPS